MYLHLVSIIPNRYAAFNISLHNTRAWNYSRNANIYLSGINLTKCKYTDRSFEFIFLEKCFLMYMYMPNFCLPITLSFFFFCSFHFTGGGHNGLHFDLYKTDEPLLDDVDLVVDEPLLDDVDGVVDGPLLNVVDMVVDEPLHDVDVVVDELLLDVVDVMVDEPLLDDVDVVVDEPTA